MNTIRAFFFNFQRWVKKTSPPTPVLVAPLDWTPCNQFVIFKPLTYCFKETIGFDVKASFAKRPVSPLIKPVDITKEFLEKAIQFHGTFHENCRL